MLTNTRIKPPYHTHGDVHNKTDLSITNVQSLWLGYETIVCAVGFIMVYT